jgi:putative methyltransferase (TIGR04325 family)
MPNVMSTVRKLPFVKSLLHKRGMARFLSPRGTGYHFGKFKTFDEARAWLPKTKEFSFESFADEYIGDRSDRIFAFDYPVIFWLQRAFGQGAASIYDIGGSVGNQFYAYRKYIDYPTSISWTVYELPLFVKIGREVAQKRNATQLNFVETLDMTKVRADVWIAAGAIELIESARMERLLEQAQTRPRHILVNKLPLHDGEEFVSTQNIGNGSFVPHRVFNRQQFIESIQRLGYRLVDIWSVPDREFVIPGQPELSFDEYSGLYFEAK